jgi:protein SCO1/2
VAEIRDIEARDIHMKGIAIGAAIIAAGIAFSVLVSLFFFEKQEAVAPPRISGPVLQTAPLQERDAYLKEKDAQLQSSGPGRIPIDEAMRRRAEGTGLRSSIPFVMVLGYASCRNLCSTVTDGVGEVLAGAGLRAGVDYTPLFVSIDPGDEGVKTYRGWKVLAGPAAPRIAREAGFVYRYDKASGEYEHPAGFVVLTPEGKLSSRFEGVRFDPAEVRDAVRAAGAGEAPGLLQSIALRCFHDPLSGRYSERILAFLRIALIAFAAGLGWILWRHR